MLGSDFVLFYILVFSAVSYGQENRAAGGRGGGLGAFSGVMGGMSMGGPSSPVINYGGSMVGGPKKSSNIDQHRFHAAAPVYKDGVDAYSTSLLVSSLHFGEEVVLDSGTQVPVDFYKHEIGIGYSHKLEGERNFGLRVSGGSASDTPFSGSRDMTFSANTSYSFPDGETSHWVLTLYVSNNNPIVNYIPIPGFIYFYRTEKFIGMFGLPFASMQWTPISPWTFSISIFGPSVGSEIIYGNREQLQSFVGFSWTQQSFLRHGRATIEDRIFVDEKKFFTGMRMPIAQNLAGELQGGFAFARSVYEGPRFEKRDHGSRGLDDAWFGAWNFRYFF